MKCTLCWAQSMPAWAGPQRAWQRGPGKWPPSRERFHSKGSWEPRDFQMDECFEVISVYRLEYRSESGVWLEMVNPKEASNMEAWLWVW